ncbi:MAG: zinc finger domain-containing protein [Nanoarchaeota archaeon]|nr:zinc finger domain-containing protein [Nanoarchaeota archaeon]
MEQKICSATKKRINNDPGSVTFPCPQCKDYEIVRSSHARRAALRYTCPKCNFLGPN